MDRTSGAWPSTPYEAALLPDVGVADGEHDDEDDHLEQTEPPQRAQLHRPRIERCGFDVKDDEQHRNKVETYRKTAGNRGRRLDAAFVGFGFVGIGLRPP